MNRLFPDVSLCQETRQFMPHIIVYPEDESAHTLTLLLHLAQCWVCQRDQRKLEAAMKRKFGPMDHHQT